MTPVSTDAATAEAVSDYSREPRIISAIRELGQRYTSPTSVALFASWWMNASMSNIVHSPMAVSPPLFVVRPVIFLCLLFLFIVRVCFVLCFCSIHYYNVLVFFGWGGGWWVCVCVDDNLIMNRGASIGRVPLLSHIDACEFLRASRFAKLLCELECFNCTINCLMYVSHPLRIISFFVFFFIFLFFFFISINY